ESEFGGAAKNVRSELKGLANDWGDLKEAIGGLFKTDAANAGFANMAANVRALSADINALTEKTDRFREANDERLAQKNAVGDAHQTALQIRRNVEEQQALLKKHAEVAARAEGRTFNRLGGFLDMRELNELSRQLNVLARERAALERLRNSQLGPLKAAKGFNIAEGAPEALKAGAKQAMGVLDSLGKQLDKVFEVKGKGKEARLAFRGLAEAINHATGNGLLAELKEQADTWGMNARQIAIYKAQLKGIPPATLAAARTLSKSIAQKEFDKAQTQREGERQQRLTDRFRELERETQTPQEELDAKLRQLDELRNADFGATKSGREVLDRAEAKFRKEFEESGRKSEGKGEGNQALLANTSEAYSAIFRAPQNSIPNQQLKEQQKQTKSLGAIERKLGKGELVVMVGKGAP
ncbi:MAG TPA: hypothetical protein VHB99_18225, partial [Pirellulales bacterium]|nr:hypothetical protein [Pirellulales bacterium]